MKTMKSYFRIMIILFILLFFNNKIISQTNSYKEVEGQVVYLNQPLSNVNISVKGKKGGTKTDIKGNYTIKVNIGDKIQYSHIGFKTVTITVEDITTILNIRMIVEANKLDEIIVKGSSKTKILERAKKADVTFKTAMGEINPRASGFNIAYIDGDEIAPHYTSLTNAIIGKTAGARFESDGLLISRFVIKPFTNTSPIWDVDGQIFNQEPSIDLGLIKDIHIIKHASSRYGNQAAGGVIVVRTKYGSFDDKESKKKITEQYTNQNYYSNDAKVGALENSFSTDSKAHLKEITGKITFLEEPLPFVNISIKNKDGGTKTDEKGLYSLQAVVGDILQYSHVSFKTITIIVEDMTKVINLEMIPKENKLDEIVVKGSKAGKALERAKKAQKKFSTARGKIDPKRAGYAVNFVEGDAVSSVYSSLSQALIGKVPGARIETTTGKFILKEATSIHNVPDVLWEVDGAIYNREPELDLSQIKSVHVLKSLASTNRYGSMGAGGVVVVQTKSGSYDPVASRNNKTAQKYQNKKTYANDAIVINQQTSNAYTQAIANFQNKNEAFSYYTNKLQTQLKDYAIHISIAQLFYSAYHDRKLSSQILTDLSAIHPKNPEILKTIAYQFQALGLKKEAVGVYQRIFKLRPSYAQSYRDLANAYRENDQYQKAWRIYMTYLLKGNDVSGEGIGQLLYNEMEWLYFNRKNQALIKERFVPKNKTINDFRNDVRLVFEWNTSEAEFDLEFVNPDKRVYSFEHSLAKNQDLITDEKQKGYASKEFSIANLDDGEWLINITYQGNKKPEPTYLKVTQYYNWSKPNQTKKIAVFQFKNEREKIQLFRLDKQVLVVK